MDLYNIAITEIGRHFNLPDHSGIADVEIHIHKQPGHSTTAAHVEATLILLVGLLIRRQRL